MIYCKCERFTLNVLYIYIYTSKRLFYPMIASTIKTHAQQVVVRMHVTGFFHLVEIKSQQSVKC